MKLCCLVILTLMLFGCAQDVANRYYLSQRYPEKFSHEVEILYSKPSRPFIVMADFQSRGENAEDMRDKAAKIGADAVIVSNLGGFYAQGEEWAHHDRYKGTYSRIIATAIKFTQEDSK